MKVINSMALKNGQAKCSLPTASLSGDMVAIKVEGTNNGVILHFDTGTSTPITFKGGDTVFGGDKTVIVPGGMGYMALDIGAFIQKSGEYKDHIILESDTTDCTVGLIELV